MLWANVLPCTETVYAVHVYYVDLIKIQYDEYVCLIV